MSAFPGLMALCLMPNHIHLLHAAATQLELRRETAHYAQWRNARRGESGPVWDPVPEPEPIGGPWKLRRQERYVHLNPPRGRLATCPLDWAFSTHRDAVGLAAFPVRAPAGDPHEYHRYISSDPSVKVDGTFLPNAPWRAPTPEKVVHAVSAATRTPLSRLTQRGPARTLAARALRTLTNATAAEIGEWTELGRRQVHRVRPARDRAVNIVATIVEDPRFAPLQDENVGLRWRGWSRERWIDAPDD